MKNVARTYLCPQPRREEVINAFGLKFGNLEVSQRVHLRPSEIQSAIEIQYEVPFASKGREFLKITNACLERKTR